MQIQSLTTTPNRSAPVCSLNLDLDTYKNITSRLLDQACTQQRSYLSQKPTLSSSKRSARPPIPVCSWRERVLELFDPALSDAEDLMLSLPYAEIREKTYVFATILDGVPSSESEGAATRRPSGYSSSSRPRSNCSTVAATYRSQEGRCTALPPGGAPIPKQRYNMPSMAKAIYTCYESVVAIIVSYNQSLGHDSEMQARRALTAALAAMDNIAS